MIVPTVTALAHASGRLPEALVSAEALARVTDLAAALPDAFSDSGLECRLDSSRRVDLLVAVIASDRGHHVLLDEPVVASVRRGVELDHIVPFCAAWARGAELQRHVPLLWLEFDLDEERAGPRRPVAFPCVRRDVLGYSATPTTQEPLSRESLTSALALLGQPISAAVAGGLARCLEALPATGSVLHVAPLATRGLAAVRLVLDLPAAALADYLARVGWPGSLGAVENILGGIYAPHEYVGFHLDIGANVRPTLGLEIVRLTTWRPVLDRLVEWSACTPEKRDALLSWPGRDWVTLPGHALPCAFERVLLVKMVHRPDAPLAAKAYLGFHHRFMMFPGSRGE